MSEDDSPKNKLAFKKKIETGECSSDSDDLEFPDLFQMKQFLILFKDELKFD